MGAPKSLTVIVESESLFNDGTAIVLFNLLLALALPAIVANEMPHQLSTDVFNGVIEFLRVSVFGIGIGVGLGWLVALLIGRIDDYLIETTLTTILAFGSYLIAERLHVSGVLAVVAAGIICGNLGLRGMSPTTQIVLVNFWEYLAFIANSLLFLLIGQDVNIPQLVANSGPILIAVIAVIASRALAVYGLTWLTNRWKRKGAKDALSRPYQHVLFWGGLRGAISLALALSLPATFADREVLRVMTFGVVLFTLLAQGTTMSWLLGRLGLIHQDDRVLEYQRRHGQLMAVRAARERVQQLAGSGLISATVWEQLAPELDQQIQIALDSQREWLQRYPALHADERNDAWREGLRAQRVMLYTLMSNGVISEPIYQELVANVDAGLTDFDS
jgi:CPA1 family monovalent cation:H+ antiporter